MFVRYLRIPSKITFFKVEKSVYFDKQYIGKHNCTHHLCYAFYEFLRYSTARVAALEINFQKMYWRKDTANGKLILWLEISHFIGYCNNLFVCRLYLMFSCGNAVRLVTSESGARSTLILLPTYSDFPIKGGGNLEVLLTVVDFQKPRDRCISETETK